jgi:hypothetical protein
MVVADNTALLKYYTITVERATQREQIRLPEVKGEGYGVCGFNRYVVVRVVIYG